MEDEREAGDEKDENTASEGGTRESRERRGFLYNGYETANERDGRARHLSDESSRTSLGARRGEREAEVTVGSVAC